MPDLIVGASETRTIPGDTVVAGWIDVLGELRCAGDLTCLGITIAPGGALRCKNLVANVVEVDGLTRLAKLAAALVRARFVSLVQVLEPPPLDVEYVHHFGGDLNPSFDYERGDRTILRDEHVEGDRVPRQFAIDVLRRELCAGHDPFAKGELVVELAMPPRPPPAPASTVVADLAAWLASHPGPQRQLLADLRATWSARIAGVAAAGAAIRKAVSSPKLAAERDAWLAELGLDKSAAAAAPRVVVHPARDRGRSES